MSVKKNIIAGWITHTVVLLIGFFLTPLVLRTLGESQYGAWVFINAVGGYAALAYAGFGTTICRYVADLGARKDWRMLNKVASSIQVVYFCSAGLALGLAVVLAALAPTLDDWGDVPVRDVQVSILLVGATIAVGMVGSVYGGVLIGMQRLDVERGIELMLGLVRLVLVLVFLTHRHGIVTLAMVFFAVSVLEQALYAFFAYRQVPTLSIGVRNFDAAVLRKCAGFSVFSAAAQVGEQVIYFTDTVVIGIVLGREAVVPYFIGSRIAHMIRVPIAHVGEAVLPRAGVLQATASRAALAKLVIRGMSLSFLLAGGFFIGAAYFGELLIHAWIGKVYALSPGVLSILLGAQVVALPASVARKALIGSGDVRVPALLYAIEAFLNLALSLVLIRYWGIVGVAWGTLLPVLGIELLVFFPYVASRLAIPLRPMVAAIVVPNVLPLLMLLAYGELISRLQFSPGWPTLLSITAGGGAVLGLALAASHLVKIRCSGQRVAAGSLWVASWKSTP